MGRDGRRIPFLLRDDLPRQGCRHLFFPIGTPDQRKKKSKKEKKRTKRKEKIYYLYIFVFLKDERIKEYIYSCLWGECCPHPCPCIAAKCRFYRSLTCPSTCPFCCPYPCPYPAAGCRFYRSLTCPSTWGCCRGSSRLLPPY